jgi:hypothetical protein
MKLRIPNSERIKYPTIHFQIITSLNRTTEPYFLNRARTFFKDPISLEPKINTASSDVILTKIRKGQKKKKETYKDEKH